VGLDGCIAFTIVDGSGSRTIFFTRFLPQSRVTLDSTVAATVKFAYVAKRLHFAVPLVFFPLHFSSTFNNWQTFAGLSLLCTMSSFSLPLTNANCLSINPFYLHLIRSKLPCLTAQKCDSTAAFDRLTAPLQFLLPAYSDDKQPKSFCG
jgi:hypothetical protein